MLDQIDRIIDVLHLKYMKAAISYEGIQRVERYFVPDAALREALLNALCHKDYASGIPIQISVYDDKLFIGNCGRLPENWTLENLLGKHTSKPYNPQIANVFYLAGMIESWGRGVEKICKACADDGSPAPEYTVHPGDIMIKFTAREDRIIRIGTKAHDKNDANHDANDANHDANPEAKLTPMEVRVLDVIKADSSLSAQKIADNIHVSRSTVQRALKMLTEKGLIEHKGQTRGKWVIL